MARTRAAAALAVIVLAVAFASPARANQPSVMNRVKTMATNLTNKVKSVASALGHKIVDWGKAAIDWTKKKFANIPLLRSLYGFLRGNPVIQWINRKGQQIVKRLERSPRSMLGTPRVTNDVPPFLKKLTLWRAKGGR